MKHIGCGNWLAVNKHAKELEQIRLQVISYKALMASTICFLITDTHNYATEMSSDGYIYISYILIPQHTRDAFLFAF